MNGPEEFRAHIFDAKNRRLVVPHSCDSWSIFSIGSIRRLKRYGMLG